MKILNTTEKFRQRLQRFADEKVNEGNQLLDICSRSDPPGGLARVRIHSDPLDPRKPRPIQNPNLVKTYGHITLGTGLCVGSLAGFKEYKFRDGVSNLMEVGAVISSNPGEFIQDLFGNSNDY